MFLRGEAPRDNNLWFSNSGSDFKSWQQNWHKSPIHLRSIHSFPFRSLNNLVKDYGFNHLSIPCQNPIVIWLCVSYYLFSFRYIILFSFVHSQTTVHLPAATVIIASTREVVLFCRVTFQWTSGFSLLLSASIHGRSRHFPILLHYDNHHRLTR